MMTHRKLKTMFCLIAVSAMLFSYLLPVAAAAPALEAPPACAETGAHEFETYTFLENGRHSAVCTLCGEVFESDCEYPDPPVYKNNENGTHSEFCALCGGERIADCEYEVEVILPTQTEAGCTRHTCTVCGYVFTDEETVPENENVTSAVMGDLNATGAVEADDARSLLRAAVSLDALPNEAIPYADMDFSGDITAADARLALRTAVGLENEIRHSYTVDVKKNAACEKPGALTCACSYCGETHGIEIPATGHSFELLNRTEPTCTKTGTETYKCTVCGAKKPVKLAATGHNFVETRVEPTCTAAGSVTNVCSVCKTKTVEEIPATGHQWVEATSKKPKHCAACGIMETGFTSVDGKIYYFNADGTLPTGKTVISATYKGTKGYWYLENGVLDLTKRAGVTVNGVNWIVTEGKAKKVSTEYDKTLFRAFQAVAKATTPNMTKAQKLKACFDYVKKAYGETRPRTPHYLGKDWVIIYANDMFVRGKGNCCSYAAAFAFMAKAIGYENVYGCNSGGHGWAEIDGLVYDPEWSKSHGTKANNYYFGVSYSANVGVNYKIIKTMNTVYSHVKI